MFFPFCWLVPSGEWLQSTPHKKAACFLVFSDIYLRKALQVKYSFLTYNFHFLSMLLFSCLSPTSPQHVVLSTPDLHCTTHSKWHNESLVLVN